MNTKNRMTIDEAVIYLTDCDRYETQGQDDKEVYWLKNGKGVATGYFNPSQDIAKIAILGDDSAMFQGSYALKLESLGTLKTLTK
jgi:hypothetical protein